MNPLNNLYAAFGSDSQITVEQRGACVEAILARELAFSLPLPSAPVEGLIKHYSETCSGLVRNQVSKFNEGFPINAQQTVDLTFVLWKFRYYLVHPRLCDNYNEIVTAALTVEGGDLNRDLAPRYQGLVTGQLPWAVRDVVRQFLAKTFA